MSALGQKQTYAVQQAMSALPPKADICSAVANVRFGPKADIEGLEPRVARPHCRGMLFQIEFFRCTNEEPQGKTIRRNSGQFASERDAEIYGFTARPEGADGFRILKDGAVRKTVSIRTEQ